MPTQAEIFADNLRRLSGIHDLSGQALAEVLKVSPQTVSHWMQGRRVPTLDGSLAIQEVFGVPVADMLSEHFTGLLPRVADVDRFEQTERRIRQKQRPLKAVSAEERKVINAKRRLDERARGKRGDI